MPVVITRFIEGITLNPKEYILDDNNEVMQFDDEESARAFLLNHGVPEEVIGNGIYIEDYDEFMENS
jgi:hypothetical protein